MPPLRHLCWMLAATLVAAGCGARAKPPKPEEEHLPRVETIRPERGLMPIHIELSAVVEPFEKADLCARVPGVIDSFQLDPQKPEVDIGRPVAAGEPLVKLSIPDLEAEKAYKEALLEQAKKQKDQTVEAQKVAQKELQEARDMERRYQADFKRAQEKHERTKRLVQGRSLSPELEEETANQLEAARAAWEVGKSQIETKQAKLNATAADLKLAEVRITVAEREVQRLAVLVDYATVRAPFGGVVTKRWLDRGAMVKDVNTPLLTVMRTDKFRILLDIPQDDVPLINATDQNPNPDGKGDLVVVRFPGLRKGGTETEFRGHITRTASALDPSTRTMRVEVHLTNRSGAVLLPLQAGMYGTASVVLDEGQDVLSVPASALARRGHQAVVYYVDDVQGQPPRGVVRRVDVEVGLDDGRRVEIRGGLTGKELVIAKGNGVLRSGDRVIPVEARKPGRDG